VKQSRLSKADGEARGEQKNAPTAGCKRPKYFSEIRERVFSLPKTAAI